MEAQVPAANVAFARLSGGGRADAVVRRIAEAITLGLVTDGEQLPSEQDLALQLGVAVGTVREGLTILRTQGLVETRRGRRGGSFVRIPEDGLATYHQARLKDMSTAELRDIGDQMLAVSGTAARLAAERAPTDLAKRLSTLITGLRDAPSIVERRRADTRFHIDVAIASQSVRLTHNEVQLQAELGPLFWLPGVDEPDANEVADEHHEIMVAITAGDAARARTLAEEHATAAIRRVMRGHLRLTDT
ncbi:FadR family transcriptional regulator [Amycolatopsis sp. H6(2020)]|nr:FadR family transcriptional regulator [Amycolatopsis sp. H6(2020)]